MHFDTSTRLVPIGKAASLFPGQRPHVATLWRWAQKGVRGVKLDTVTIGGRRYVDPESVARFIDATSAGAAGIAPPVTPLTAWRRAAIAAARAHLDSRGL